MIMSVRAALTGVAAMLVLSASSAMAEPDGAIALPGDSVHPESISVTPDGTAYVGSLMGGVLKVSLKTGKAVRFVAPGTSGSGALLGVLADSRHGILWTCTTELVGSIVKVAGADPGHWVKGFDLKTGKGRLSLRVPGEGDCNDFAVGTDGAVYISDFGKPRVLRWKPGVRALEIWLEDSQLGAPDKSGGAEIGGGLDGIVAAADGALYVNNYFTGALFRVAKGKNGRPGTVTRIVSGLGSPDGMRPLPGGDLVTTDGKGRLLRIGVAGDTAKVTSLAEGLAEPTAVGFWNGRVWYTGAQFGPLFSPGKVKPDLPFKLTPVRIAD